MTDIENEVCYNCGKVNRQHTINELYLCLSRFSNMVRTFDRAWNFSVYQSTKRDMEFIENRVCNPENLKP